MWFKIVGDNIDITLRPRYMRFDKQNTSIHSFQSFALKDRVNFSHLSDSPPSEQPNFPQIIEKLLPNDNDDLQICDEFAVLVARMLCTYMKFFKESFADVVDWHIPHKYSTEMSNKSVIVSFFLFSSKLKSSLPCLMQVPLGVLSKCETKRSEMIEIMTFLHQYVPSSTSDSSEETVHQILFGGDQLTAARARGCQEVRMNSDTCMGKLNGLRAVSEDWHTSVVLLTVSSYLNFHQKVNGIKMY